ISICGLNGFRALARNLDENKTYSSSVVSCEDSSAVIAADLPRWALKFDASKKIGMQLKKIDSEHIPKFMTEACQDLAGAFTDFWDMLTQAFWFRRAFYAVTSNMDPLRQRARAVDRWPRV
ncbi:MAG: hypothetical protein LBC41_09135, partial [Clostridiales bacterium]|nr:hypothetical protein [Clostridiales bacterium]